MILWTVFSVLSTAQFSVLWAMQIKGGCPPFQVVYPCICHPVIDNVGQAVPILICKQITSEDTLKEIVEGTKGHKFFELKLIDSSLGHIPHDTFQDASFQFLSFENSRIQALTDTNIAFEGLADTLVMLEFINCTFVADWDWSQLTHLTRLQEVAITNSEVVNLTDGLSAVHHLEIKAIVLSGNNIKNLGSHVFSSFDLLTRLSLNENSIQEIQRSMLPWPAKFLQKLELSYNKLTRLPKDMFLDMPALNALFLTGNKLRILDESVFRPVWKQIKLVLFQDTELACDCRLSWITRNTEPKDVYGECHDPPHLNGKAVTNLREEDLWC